MNLTPLPPVIFLGLDTTSFASAPCEGLALALFENKSISLILNEIENCCNPQSLFNRFVSCFFESPPQAKEKCPLLDRKFSDYRIAPIHLAAMRQNFDAIVELADRGVNLDAQDFHGFTPFHHMAMQGNLAGLKTLDSLGANKRLRTNDGASAAQLLRFNAPFTNPSEWALQEEAVKARHDIHPSCLEEGVSVVDRAVASPQVLTDLLWSIRNHLVISKVHPRLEKHLLAKHKEFIKDPPRLAIQPNSHLNSCGLNAIHAIQKGDILGYYAGELHSIVGGVDLYGKAPDEEYLFSGSLPIDAKQFRSPAAMANDSFPNACIMPLSSNNKGVGGLPYQLVVIALEPMEPGEEIFIDYGSDHAIKKEGHIELRKNALISYFSRSSLDQLLDTVRSSLSMKTGDGDITVMEFIVKMSYLDSTPGAFELLQSEAGLDDTDLIRLREVYHAASAITTDTRRS